MEFLFLLLHLFFWMFSFCCFECMNSQRCELIIWATLSHRPFRQFCCFFHFHFQNKKVKWINLNMDKVNWIFEYICLITSDLHYGFPLMLSFFFCSLPAVRSSHWALPFDHTAQRNNIIQSNKQAKKVNTQTNSKSTWNNRLRQHHLLCDRNSFTADNG